MVNRQFITILTNLKKETMLKVRQTRFFPRLVPNPWDFDYKKTKTLISIKLNLKYFTQHKREFDIFLIGVK